MTSTRPRRSAPFVIQQAESKDDQPPPIPFPPPPLTMVSSRNCFLSAQRAPSEVLCSLLTCFLNLFSLKKRVVKKRVVV